MILLPVNGSCLMAGEGSVMHNLGYILIVAQAPATLVDFAGEFFLEMRQNNVSLRRSDGCVNSMKAAYKNK